MAVVEHFSKYAEEIPNGETCKYLSKCARENNIFIVGGSIPEAEGSRLYNTSTVWNPQGELIAKHRKVSREFWKKKYDFENSVSSFVFDLKITRYETYTYKIHYCITFDRTSDSFIRHRYTWKDHF